MLGASRTLVFLVPLIATPIFSRIFDARTFGAWTILGSLITLLSAQDFGICSALRVHLAELQVAGDQDAARNEFHSVFAVILVTAVVLSALLLALHPNVSFLGVPMRFRTATYAAIIIGLVSVSAAVPFQALYAYLDAHLVAASDVVRALLQIVAALVIYATTRNILLCLVVFYAPTVGYIYLSYELLRRRRSWRNPYKNGVHTWWVGARRMRRLAVDGIPFLALSVLNLALGPLDLLLAGRYLGLVEAGSLGLVMKLVNVGYAFLGAISWGYVGAYGMEFMNQNYAWIRKTIVVQIAAMVVLGIVATVALVLFGESVVHLWSGRVVAERGLYLLAGIVFLSGGINRLLLSVIQGVGRVGSIIVPLTVCALAKIWIAVSLIPNFRADGILLATTITNLMVAAVAFVQLRRLLVQKS